MVRLGLDDFFDRYHSAEYPYSFAGKNTVKQHVRVKRKVLDKILSKSDIYTGFREFKKSNDLPPIRTYGENYLWEGDLMFFTHPDFVKANDGNLYILAMIDSFTKMVRLTPLRTKDTKTVTARLLRVFNFEKPKYLRVDAGGEFISNQFTSMCKDQGVKLYIAMEPIKCAFIERFNRTFKRILVQIMENNNTIRWIDHIREAIDIYHSRWHSSLKMSPNEAEQDENHDKIHEINLNKYIKFDRKILLKNRNPPKFKRGQIVKIFKKKGIFSKGYIQNSTTEFFEIYHIDRKLSRDRYYLKDLNGDKILGSFYDNYLVAYTPPADGAEYRIDPTFKGFKKRNINRVPHIWVKWLGWPEKFNQFVPLSDVRHLLPEGI